MAEVVFYSSGSTGNAKRIVRSEEALCEDAAALVRAFPEIWEKRPYVVASVLPEHMYGALWRVRAPRFAQCEVYAGTVASVEELLSLKESRGSFLFVTTPSFLEKALLHPDFPLLRGAFIDIVTSGSALRGETSLAVQRFCGVCPLEIYGSTESGTVAWRRQSEGEAATLMAEVEASVSEAGLLCVDSPYAMIRPYLMPDKVELLSPRRILLKGRADRQVKILEQLVSLSEVESVMAAHPAIERVRVETYGEKVPRLGALVVLTENGREELAKTTFAAYTSSLRADLRGKLAALAIPRRIRFVREMPVNEQGKTTAAAVCDKLLLNCREPVVLNWSETAAEISATLVFPPDLECFNGHFPGFPVLPGVAQLYFLEYFLQSMASTAKIDKAASPLGQIKTTYRKLKFQKLILPSMPVEFKVKKLTVNSFAFSFSVESGMASSGVLERSTIL